MWRFWVSWGQWGPWWQKEHEGKSRGWRLGSLVLFRLDGKERAQKDGLRMTAPLSQEPEWFSEGLGLQKRQKKQKKCSKGALSPGLPWAWGEGRVASDKSDQLSVQVSALGAPPEVSVGAGRACLFVDHPCPPILPCWVWSPVWPARLNTLHSVLQFKMPQNLQPLSANEYSNFIINSIDLGMTSLYHWVFLLLYFLNIKVWNQRLGFSKESSWKVAWHVESEGEKA